MSLRAADLLDIAVVATLLYLAFAWLRRRRAYSAVALVAAVLVLYQVARWLNMYLTLALFQVGVTAMVLGFLVVFQEEVRSGIEGLTSRRKRRKGAVGGQRGESLIGNLSEALDKMAEAHTGALIVLHGREPISLHVEGGILMNGRVSVPLLLSLFNPKSPAHDGAVIVFGDRIERFAVHLPLSTDLGQLGERGTRHAAALGLSERCDALALVVSEERGTISVAEEGRLRQLSSPAESRLVLERFVEDRHPSGPQPWTKVASVREWVTAASAVAVAILLWAPFARRGVEKIQQTVVVPVALTGVPEGWRVTGPDPSAVEVTLSGSPNAFDLLDPDELRQSIDPARSMDRGDLVPVDPADLEGLPDGLTVVEIRPDNIRVSIERQRAGESDSPGESTGTATEAAQSAGQETSD